MHESDRARQREVTPSLAKCAACSTAHFFDWKKSWKEANRIRAKPSDFSYLYIDRLEGNKTGRTSEA